MSVPPLTVIRPGQVFMIPSGPQGEHLFVSIVEAKLINGVRHVLLASLCSVKEGIFNDETCLVQPGDHSFVVRPSFIEYSKLRVERESDVLNLLDKGYYECRHEDFKPELLSRVLTGVGTSKHVKRFVRDAWL